MKKKIIIISLIVLIGILLINTISIGAGYASGSAPASVENGSNVTFTVTVNAAAWNVRLSASGATSGGSESYADVTADGSDTSRRLSLTCRATSEGTITFTATGDITSSDGANSNVSITKTVEVVKPREKETEARLSSLAVEGYDISFNADTYEYSLVVEPTVSSIDINAKAISSFARIDGTGTKEINEDETFEILVTAENGATKTYKLNVSIKDNDPINIQIDNNTYTVVKTNKKLTCPKNFTESTVKIKDYDIPCFANEKLNMTLIGITDSEGKIHYAVYKEEEYQLFNENLSTTLRLYILEKELEGYEKVTATIGDNEYVTYKYNDRFVIVYAMNLETGEYNYYKYDQIDKTFQVFEIEEKVNSMDNWVYIIIIVVLSIIAIILIIYIIVKKEKRSK